MSSFRTARLTLTAGGIALVHYVVSVWLWGLLYVWGEYGTPPSQALATVLSALDYVLLFPVLYVVAMLDRWLPVPDRAYELSFVLNSLLWAICLTWIVCRYRRRATGSVAQREGAT